MPFIPAPAVNLVKDFEDCKLTAYKCPAGIWTIGYGQTGPDIGPGLVWTQGEADRRLADSLDDFAHQVEVCLARPGTPNQFGAMVSLAYNIGAGNFRKSSVLRFHNAGQTDQAADAFKMWNKAGGQVLPGLVRRREAERALYLNEEA